MKRDLQNCLEYCKQQNGMSHCKNCGLTQKMIDGMIDMPSAEITYTCEKCGLNMSEVTPTTMVCDNPDCGWNMEKTHCDLNCTHEHLCIGANCKRDDKDGAPMPHDCKPLKN